MVESNDSPGGTETVEEPGRARVRSTASSTSEHQLVDFAAGVSWCCELALDSVGNRNSARPMLQMMRQAAANRLPGATSPQKSQGHGKVILVADDNPLVLVAIEQLLREAGHLVLGAQSYQEAMRLYDLVAGRIDAVVSDLALGEDDGRCLTAALREHAPGLPIVYITASRHATADGPILQKPVVPADLHRAIDAVFSASDHRSSSSAS